MLTYGDGLADIDIPALREFHFAHGKIGTVTAVHPTSRFGELGVEGENVVDFAEKPDLNTGFVNGGYFMFDRKFLDYVTDPNGDMLESDALQRLTADGQLGNASPHWLLARDGHLPRVRGAEQAVGFG